MALWMGLALQFTMRLNSSAAAMPAMASLAASQRVRVTPCVHARRKGRFSDYRTHHRVSELLIRVADMSATVAGHSSNGGAVT
jgi:hypothetical protein